MQKEEDLHLPSPPPPQHTGTTGAQMLGKTVLTRGVREEAVVGERAVVGEKGRWWWGGALLKGQKQKKLVPKATLSEGPHVGPFQTTGWHHQGRQAGAEVIACVCVCVCVCGGGVTITKRGGSQTKDQGQDRCAGGRTRHGVSGRHP